MNVSPVGQRQTLNEISSWEGLESINPCYESLRNGVNSDMTDDEWDSDGDLASPTALI